MNCTSEDCIIMDEVDSNENDNIEFNTRCYQQELFECATQKNSILVLGTGSGKTFISIMLIKEFGEAIRGLPSEGAKRTVFVVNTVPLVHQQSSAIARHTPFKVGLFEGSMGVDFWSEEKWKEEIDKHNILVMVAEIFKNLILHNRLPLTHVNLIIMDECHHATGKHPMREIMQEYALLKEKKSQGVGIELPRILGLTACVIHQKCKQNEVKNLMKKLENTMDCALVTSIYQDIVKQHTTRPKEIIIQYVLMEKSSLITIVTEILKVVYDKMIKFVFDKLQHYKNDNILKKKKKSIARIIVGIQHSLAELGDYVLVDAMKLEAQYLREAEADFIEEQEINMKFASSLEEALLDLPKVNKEDPFNHISSKVQRLLEVLALYAKHAQNVKILVFVERRNTAKLLHSLLLAIKDFDPELQYLQPESIVGGATNMKDDLKVNVEIEKQKKIMAKFRKGECNIIFSTSVLEEGIDVQKCNVVIRFDNPKDFRSYIQSLGRARAVPSKYVMLAKVNESQELKGEILLFKEILHLLLEHCHDRALPKVSEILDSFKDNENEPSYVPYGVPGPKITFNSAIQVINKYCGTLPHDKFSQLVVNVKYIYIDNKIQVHLALPHNAPLKDSVPGNIKDNRDDAKKSAALALCIKLHKMGELDENLLPRKIKLNTFISQNLAVKDEEIEGNKPRAGTRKRRQIYERKLCSSFIGSDLSQLYLHYIDFEIDSGDKLKSKNKKIGFLCSKPIDCCRFVLYCDILGKVEVNIQFVKCFSLNESIIKLIKHFHMVTYQLLLNLNQGMMIFNPESLHQSIFLVPLTNSRNIDVPFLETISRFTSLEDLANSATTSLLDRMPFVFDSNSFNDAVIMPSYRSPEYFMVEKVLSDMNPMSEFPECKKKFSSFKDYFYVTYNKEISNLQQSLLQCRHFPKELNHIKVKPNTRSSKDNSDHHPIFVPELCLIIPFSATHWWQIIMVPSIFHRLNGLLLERELFNLIQYNSNLQTEKKFHTSQLDYFWCSKEVRASVVNSSSSNLVVSLNRKNGMSIYPGMVLQALTPISSGDNFNLERLEVLGDSFLKYSVSVYLFCTETSNHEGKLTMERSYIVSNKTLYMLAKEKNLPELYQGFVLNRSNAVPFGFQILQDLEAILRAENVDPNLWLTYFQRKDATDVAVEKAYHPWIEQSIPDKCIADCCESLIGLYLLNGGEAAAKHLMMWLGFEFLNKVYLPPRTAIIKDDILPSQVNGLYKKLCLDKLERIIGYNFKNRSFLIQAVTHPSDIQNKITDCYQRLEFLGDAVLDYLITGYIFAEFDNYDPGELTDLRSHLVKNDTLARAAVKQELHKYLLHSSPKLNTTINIFLTLIEDGEMEFNTEDDTIEAEDVEVPKALGDLVEAVIGAIYVDSGQSLQKCWDVVQTLLQDEFMKIKTAIPIDNVRKLYEMNHGVKFEYKAPTEEDNKAICLVKMEGFPTFTGMGKNKRTAKQAAAKLALFHLGKKS